MILMPSGDNERPTIITFVMFMNGEFSVYKNSKLFYTKSGHGQSVILAFHGFGQDHSAFNTLANALDNSHTLYTFDLFFHGQSEWGYGEAPLERDFWKTCVEEFLKDNAIEKFSVTGFSLGCRLAMALAEDFSHHVETVFLLAPDGVKTSFWYSISTYPWLLRRGFKSMIEHPARFKIIVNTLHEARLMDKGLLKFAEHQMNTVAKRRKVYYTWVVFRHIKVNLKHFISVMNDRKIQIVVAVGKNDRVIRPGDMKSFVRRLKTGTFHILSTGHADLLKDNELSKLFLTSTK